MAIKKNVSDKKNSVKQLNKKEVDIESSTLKVKRNISSFGIRKMPKFTKKVAAPTFASKSAEVENLIKQSFGLTPAIDSSRGKKPSFIAGRFTSNKVNSSAQAIAALKNLHYTMGFENAEQEYKEASVKTLDLGTKTTFYRLQQYHEGIPVYGRQLVVTADEDGNVGSVSGHYAEVSSAKAPAFSEASAQAIVEKDSTNSDIILEGLHYYMNEKDKAILCWKISTEFNTYFINAASGAIVTKINLVDDYGRYILNTGNNLVNETVEFPVVVEKNVRKLQDVERNIYINRCDGESEIGDLITTTNSSWAGFEDAIAAYENIIKTYDYYYNNLGCKGADGKGKKINISIGYYVNKNQKQWDNAESLTKSSYTKIGLGSGNGNYARSLDVIAHEFTHSVIRCCGWDPDRNDEPGALNEGLADTMAEFVQDGVLDLHGEQLAYGANRSFSNPTVAKYSQHKTFISENKNAGDRGNVHDNGTLICHAFYWMEQYWPTGARFSAEMPIATFMAMHLMSSNSNFLDFRSCLVAAARVAGFDSNRIKAIVDAFNKVEISYDTVASSGFCNIKGSVVDNNGAGIADAVVLAYRKDLIPFDLSAVPTDSDGKYSIPIKYTGTYAMVSSATAYIPASKTVSVSKKGNLSISNFVLKKDPKYTKSKNFLQGTVKNSEDEKAIQGTTVRIIKGITEECKQRVCAGYSDIVLTTDQNGHYSTMNLEAGAYTILAYRNVSDKFWLVSRTAVTVSGNTSCNLTLSKMNRHFVHGVSIAAGNSRDKTLGLFVSNCIKVDRDMNHGAGGKYIYMAYSVSAASAPVTNLLLVKSSRALTWTTKELTCNGKKATYRRLNISLNSGTKGSYVYLCYTTSTAFKPLTAVDVIYDSETLKDPWKIVPWENSTTDGNVNIGSKGKPVYIIFKR